MITKPLSTLIPGRIPFDWRSFEKLVPSADDWSRVSSNRITPLMYFSTP